jgi:HK97 family phage portal protein
MRSLFSRPAPVAAGGGPRADLAGGVTFADLSSPEAAEFFRTGGWSGGGMSTESAMRVAVAYRCTHIIAGACGNLPIDLYRRIDERTREPATGHPIRALLQRPNAWQTASEFRKMLTAHAVLKGNGYAVKVRGVGGRVRALWPLNNPDRMKVTQDPATMALVYEWTRLDGVRVPLAASEVLHLRGLTLDGVVGVGVIKYARSALGLSLQAEATAGKALQNGVMSGLVFTKSGVLSPEAFDRLKAQIDEQNAGPENAGKSLILEDDLKVDGAPMSAEDLQFLQGREFARSDVGMFYGVPPHMYGDTSKATSWGTGIEAQGAGFVTWTANDWFVMWEQALERDLLSEAEIAQGYYVRLQRQALQRADQKGRWESYTRALQWGVYSPDDVRALEDLNPRPDGLGGRYYEPPNTAGQAAGEAREESPDDRNA